MVKLIERFYFNFYEKMFCPLEKYYVTLHAIIYKVNKQNNNT